MKTRMVAEHGVAVLGDDSSVSESVAGRPEVVTIVVTQSWRRGLPSGACVNYSCLGANCGINYGECGINNERTVRLVVFLPCKFVQHAPSRCSPPACSARCTRSKAASHVPGLAATATTVTTVYLWPLPWHANVLRRPLRRLRALRLSRSQCSARRHTPTRTATYLESGSALLLGRSAHVPGSWTAACG